VLGDFKVRMGCGGEEERVETQVISVGTWALMHSFDMDID